MPGIFGIIGAGAPEERGDALRRMLQCMMHEPSYTSGTYVNEDIGLWIGWINHKGAFSDCMPVWNETKDVCLIFWGEDFRDATEVENLKARGHVFTPENASYLVHFYEQYGIQFIERINGCFSGVLVDIRRKTIALFNDRYGLGRIYYHERPGALFFSSEAKSVLKILPELRRLNLTSLAETFSCGCVLQNRTLFSGIELLPGGSVWISDGTGNIQKRSYFDSATWEQQAVLSGTEYYSRLRDTFGRILPRYLDGKQNVGMSLTGGLDGRIIMAWAKQPPNSLPCYTFGGSCRDCADVRIARRIAACCQQTHETIAVGDRFLSEFPTQAESCIYISDGTMDATGSVELYVNRIARQIAPVRLTGNYGSEILRGNVAFRPIAICEDALAPEFARLVRDAALTYDVERQGNTLTFIAFKQVPWHHYSRLAVEQSQLTMRSPYLDNDLVSLMYQAPHDQITSAMPVLRLIEDGNPDLAEIPTDRGLLYRPTPLVTKCKHAYQEFTVKAEYAYDYGMPQWLAAIDHILSPFRLEKLFLGRHKFYHFRVWYRNPLSNYVKEMLLDARTLNRPYYSRKCLESMVNGHVKGHRNYTREIHRVLTSELIQRNLIEQP
jgi:asparagine synthase (glutamine-hydrolysing)